MKIRQLISAALAFVILFVVSIAGQLVISFLMSWPLMLLWNGCLVDAVTYVRPVTWLQMWGIAILISALTNTLTKGNPKGNNG